MLGRGFASFAALAAILVVGSSVASGQENPVLDLESVQPVIPYSVAQQLAARGEDVDDLKQRHPWVPNNAPFPLNITYVTGSYRNANGSTTLVYCALDVAAEHPYWYQGNMLRTLAVGGARCNVRLAEEAGGGMTGTVRALSFPSRSQLASASLGSQHQVPEGQGSGWQSYGVATFDRANANSNQQIQLEARLVLPAWPGTTNIGWNNFGAGCTRGANAREVNCQFSSPPFQTLPYPCPTGSVGIQPPGCAQAPAACDIANGQYGIQPNCFSVPSRPECSGPMYPGDNPEYQCPEDDDLPGKWGPEDGFYADLEEERQDLEEDTGQTVPGGPLPNASTASGNDNNDDDPHFEAPDTRCVYEPDGPQPACVNAVEWCNSDYRVRRKWCYSKYTFGRTRAGERFNITGSKLRGSNSKSVYVCTQIAKYPIYSEKRYETCNTNIAKTGYHRPPKPRGTQWHGECEHFHVKKQWVWCNWHKTYPD